MSRCSAELFIVEGLSAAHAVNAVRSRKHQAVVGLQGKVPNVSSASGLRRALANKHIQELLTVMSPFRSSQRFSRVLVLFDADADGLQARRLLEMFFRSHLPELINQGFVYHVYPPLYELRDRKTGKVNFGWNRCAVDDRLKCGCEIRYFKGLGGMSAEILAKTCVNSESRISHPISVLDSLEK